MRNALQKLIVDINHIIHLRLVGPQVGPEELVAMGYLNEAVLLIKKADAMIVTSEVIHDGHDPSPETRSVDPRLSK